jgi:hypothetical protein
MNGWAEGGKRRETPFAVGEGRLCFEGVRKIKEAGGGASWREAVALREREYVCALSPRAVVAQLLLFKSRVLIRPGFLYKCLCVRLRPWTPSNKYAHLNSTTDIM